MRFMNVLCLLLLSACAIAAPAQRNLSGYTLDVAYPDAVLVIADAKLIPANSGPGSYAVPSCRVKVRTYASAADYSYEMTERNTAMTVADLQAIEYVFLEERTVDIVDSSHRDGSGAIVQDSQPYTQFVAGVDASDTTKLIAAAYQAMAVQGNTQSLMAGSTAMVLP